jgi:hypothetical protein
MSAWRRGMRPSRILDEDMNPGFMWMIEHILIYKYTIRKLRLKLN